MKQNTKRTISLVALLAIAALFAGLYLHTRPTSTPGQKSIEITVVHSNSSEKTFHYDTDAEYLGPMLLADGLVKGEPGAYGLYIKEVDGEVADFPLNGAYWALYEGESYATTGIDATVLEDGDQFSLVYTIG